MVFDNSEALIEHLKTLGKVIQRGSQLEYIESRKIARPEKEMPREALQLAHKLAKNVKEHFDFVKLACGAEMGEDGAKLPLLVQSAVHQLRNAAPEAVTDA